MADNERELTRRIQEVLAQAFQVPQELVTPDLRFGDLPQWDSMGHMEVMMRLEEHFGVEINADTIAALTSIPAIREHIVQGDHTKAGNE
ncbi:MAG: acyl carrier protein [Anaerolineales bacterium]|nr:acyl carrier protein [Anaerolineales bacterium]